MFSLDVTNPEHCAGAGGEVNDSAGCSTASCREKRPPRTTSPSFLSTGSSEGLPMGRHCWARWGCRATRGQRSPLMTNSLVHTNTWQCILFHAHNEISSHAASYNAFKSTALLKILNESTQQCNTDRTNTHKSTLTKIFWILLTATFIGPLMLCLTSF